MIESLGFYLLPVLPILAFFIYWFIQPLIQSIQDPHALSYTHSIIDPKTNKIYPFPSLLKIDSKVSQISSTATSSSSSSPPRDPNGHQLSVSLSVIVPAYNEQARLDAMMKPTLDYLTSRSKSNPSFSYEVIIVDDGSRDSTVSLAHTYSSLHGIDVVRVLKLKANQGKGGAVQQGMLHARGEWLLMADADGATEFKDLEALESKAKQVEEERTKKGELSRNDGIVIVGSRAHYERDAVAKRAWYRNILMYGFHFLVSTLCPTDIQDTQCGFKLFNRSAAIQLFSTQHLRRWCFDVELLFVAKKLGMSVAEVAVNWQEIPGSKLQLVEASLLMGRDLCVIRFAYLSGMWTIHQAGKKDGPSQQGKKQS